MTERPVLFRGGRILSMQSSSPDPEVVVVRGGLIEDAGGAGIVERHPDAHVVELAGRTLVPGLIDAHNHLSLVALHPLWADLREVRTLDGLAAALREAAEREPEAEWIRGFGWETSGDLPPVTRRDLDAIGLDRPVILAHFSIHQCVVDSRALDRLGIGRGTPDPPDGIIDRDASGEPTGMLVEGAWSEAHARSLAAYADPDRWPVLIAERARALLAEGITCVHDAACSPRAEAAYRRLAQTGDLPVSVVTMPHAAELFREPPASRLEGPPTGEGDELLRVGPVKLFADGGARPAIRGADGIRFPGLAEAAERAAARGFRLAVHAMGDAGLDDALDAFEAVVRREPGADHRFRVEHVTLAAPAQLRRMRELGAVGVVQPGFLDPLGSRLAGAERVGEASWMPFRSILESGIPIAASSDDPCAPWRPLQTSSMGATRRTPAGDVLGSREAVDMQEWLRAYTSGAAYAGGQEDERGSIAPGKRADLVVLDGPVDTGDPPGVDETWVGGQRVFSRS